MELVESRNKINCMKIINDKLLLGSYENLIIYNINNKDIEIKFDRKILIFRNEDINDFLETNYKKILLCSNKNNFKLIELTSDFHLIQEFKGLENSKNIFCIVELSNKMILSGDCENIILWDYLNINNKYKIIQNEKLYNIYSIIEIKHTNNEVIIGAAEPDSKSIIIMKIENNKKL